tara:strand:+ start:108 stop:413 length:306 start_codon:yes stop_codon:yes gene_type:complete
MRPWSRITTDTHITEQLQDNMEPLMKAVEQSDLLKGTLLEKIELDGDTSVPHGLERRPTGWLVVRKRAPAIISDRQDDNPNPEKSLALVSSAPVTVDLWVF